MPRAKNRDEHWREKRQAIRDEYMELALYPDQYKGPEGERQIRLAELEQQIKKFRYRSIRNFINEVYGDAMAGILNEDVTRVILKYLRGYRDKITWEHIAKAHQLTVNGQQSPWVDIKVPAEVEGYIAFYKSPNTCRIIRAINVNKFKVI